MVEQRSNSGGLETDWSVDWVGGKVRLLAEDRRKRPVVLGIKVGVGDDAECDGEELLIQRTGVLDDNPSLVDRSIHVVVFVGFVFVDVLG